MFYGNVETKLKFRKIRNRWENSTQTCTFDAENLSAYSYGWWKFVSKIKGKTVFNSYGYSNSTGAHQSAVKDLMKQMKIKIDLIVNTRASLSKLDFETALEDVYVKMFKAEYTLSRKGLTEKTKDKAKYTINLMKKDIKTFSEIGLKASKEQIEKTKKMAIEQENERLAQNRGTKKETEKSPKYIQEMVKLKSGIYTDTF